jgi:hypothetical protein
MTIRRMALQAAVGNLTQNQSITADSNGFLISAGLLVYAYIQNVSATDKILGRASAGAGVIEEIACTAAGRALLDDTDAAAQRTTLGLGTIATQAANNVSITGGTVSGITDLAIADGGTDSSTASQARVSLGINNIQGRLYAVQIPTKILNSYWHASFDEHLTVQGTWGISTDASQTDFDDSLVSSAGYIANSTAPANNDEIHFGSLTLNAGTYKVSFATVKHGDLAIIEILHGTTSLGTFDCYVVGATQYNIVSTFTYSPTTRVTGNLRLKVSNKNGSATSYLILCSRLEIIRTG